MTIVLERAVDRDLHRLHAALDRGAADEACLIFRLLSSYLVPGRYLAELSKLFGSGCGTPIADDYFRRMAADACLAENIASAAAYGVSAAEVVLGVSPRGAIRFLSSAPAGSLGRLEERGLGDALDAFAVSALLPIRPYRVERLLARLEGVPMDGSGRWVWLAILRVVGVLGDAGHGLVNWQKSAPGSHVWKMRDDLLRELAADLSPAGRALLTGSPTPIELGLGPTAARRRELLELVKNWLLAPDDAQNRYSAQAQLLGVPHSLLIRRANVMAKSAAVGLQTVSASHAAGGVRKQPVTEEGKRQEVQALRDAWRTTLNDGERAGAAELVERLRTIGAHAVADFGAANKGAANSFRLLEILQIVSWLPEPMAIRFLEGKAISAIGNPTSWDAIDLGDRLLTSQGIGLAIASLLSRASRSQKMTLAKPLLDAFTRSLATIGLDGLAVAAKAADHLVEIGDEVGDQLPRLAEADLFGQALTTFGRSPLTGMSGMCRHDIRSCLAVIDHGAPRWHSEAAIFDLTREMRLARDKEDRLRAFIALGDVDGAIAAASSLRGGVRSPNIGRKLALLAESQLAAGNYADVEELVEAADGIGAPTPMLTAVDLVAGHNSASAQARISRLKAVHGGLATVAELLRLKPETARHLAAYIPSQSYADLGRYDDDSTRALLMSATDILGDITHRLIVSGGYELHSLRFLTFLKQCVASQPDNRVLLRSYRDFGAAVRRGGGDIGERAREIVQERAAPAAPRRAQGLAATLLERLTDTAIAGPLDDLSNEIDDFRRALTQAGAHIDDTQQALLEVISGLTHVRALPARSSDNAVHHGALQGAGRVVVARALAFKRNGDIPQLSEQIDLLETLRFPTPSLVAEWLAASHFADTPLHMRIDRALSNGLAMRQIAEAWKYLGPTSGADFLRSLPSEPFESGKQWRNTALLPFVSANPHFLSAVLQSFLDRLEKADILTVKAMAEACVKNLLKDLPEALQVSTYGQLLLLNRHFENRANASATLRKFYGAKIDDKTLSKLIAVTAKQYGPDTAGAIVFGRALKKRRLDIASVVDELEALGDYRRAHSLLTALKSEDHSLTQVLNELEGAVAVGDRDVAVHGARELSAASAAQVSGLDRLRLRYLNPLFRKVAKLTGRRPRSIVDQSIEIVARRVAAARASTLLGDPEEVRARFEALSNLFPRQFSCAGVGALLVVGDFDGAEAMSAAYVRYHARRLQRKTLTAQKVLESLGPLLEHGLIQQKHFLNAGRDVNYLDSILELVGATLDDLSDTILNAAQRKGIGNVIIQVLRLSLNGTTTRSATDTRLIAFASTLARNDVAMLARLSQVLDSQWHPASPEITRKAFSLASAQFQQVLDKYLPSENTQGDSWQMSAKRKALVQKLSVVDASRLARGIIQVLSLAERVDDLETPRRLSSLTSALLDTAISKKWVTNGAIRGLAKRAMTSLAHVAQPLEFFRLAQKLRPSDIDAIISFSNALQISGEDHEARRILGAAVDRWPMNMGLLSAMSGLQANLSDERGLVESQQRLVALHESAVVKNSADGKRVRELLTLRVAIAGRTFWSDSSKVLRRVPPPRRERPKGVVFASFYNCMTSASITTMPFLELRRRGYDVVYLKSGTISAESTGHPILDQFSGILQGDGTSIAGEETFRANMFHSWQIEPENRIIMAEGLNFYQPIFERLTQQSKTFTLDFDSETIRNRIRSMVRQCDRALHVAMRIRDEVAALGIPVRFVSSNWQYPPYCTFRIAAAKWVETHDIGFVAVSPGYESYFSNLGKRYATTAAALNMSVNAKSRAPFLPVAARFDRWYDANSEIIDGATAEIEAQIRADRAGTGQQLVPEARATRDRIEAHRRAGGKVVCAFGKIVYDLAVPYSGGPAHRDMEDYINHTVEAAAKAPQTLLLIKPHPHELRYEIARNPRQFFTDLIKRPIPDNVVLLGHRWFNMRDIIPMIDLGVLWNGTASVELAASGVPVVMCDDWGPRDYPVGFQAPRDRKHFEEIIRNPTIVPNAPELRRRSIALLKYLSTTDVMRPYQYVERGLVNVDVGPPVWRPDDVNAYLEDGDPFVEALADDFLFRPS